MFNVIRASKQRVLMLVAVSLGFAACDSSDDPASQVAPPLPNIGEVHVIHASPYALAVNVNLDGKVGALRLRPHYLSGFRYRLSSSSRSFISARVLGNSSGGRSR